MSQKVNDTILPLDALHTKHVFSENAKKKTKNKNKNAPQFLSHTCTECSFSIQNSILKVTLGASTFCKLKVRFITKVLHMRLNPRIIVYKSHENTVAQVDIHL